MATNDAGLLVEHFSRVKGEGGPIFGICCIGSIVFLHIWVLTGMKHHRPVSLPRKAGP